MRTDRDILEDPRITLMGLFTEAYDALSERVAQQIAQHQLNGAEFEALLRLSRSPGQCLRMSDLAAQAGLTNSGATRLVDRLAARGLIARENNPLDRRGTTAVITATGLATVLKVLPDHIDMLQKTLIEPLNDTQRDALTDALRTLRDSLRPEASGNGKSDPR
jgi:MarR family 2-MHQ and catechol resistance regulon transcriptional repressor